MKLENITLFYYFSLQVYNVGHLFYISALVSQINS